ncbi:inactive peptidyl-prolyl cis-trans isomerase FKBP6-like isoform X2 [Mercenaria mercenaria]|nr:inactive peptidyl-prolyl cis-trans isomerase FKBP6-like isoform X2 [Mercenaria mercenaria]
MEDICPDKDGGILKQLLKHGSGPVVPPGSLVRIHFNGYLEYADEPFDSTRLQGRELRFRLGNGEVIDGQDVAVSTMRKGEVSRFLVKPEYAYLSMGVPPRIPPNATVLFEIELLHFVEQAGLDDYFSMTEEEKRNVAFSDIKKLYHSITKEAKHLFQEDRIRQAFPKYKKACSLLENRHIKDEAEEKEQQELLVRVYLNMALCCVKQSHSGRAISYTRKCLDIDKENAKALYLQGKALHQQGEFERAKDFLKRAQRKKPKDRDVNAELIKVEENMAKCRIMEKDMCKKMFANPRGQTAKEKEAEDTKIEKARSRSIDVTPEFRQLVMEKLQAFREDEDLMEIPMPSFQFSVGEIDCIMETAESLDLEAKVRGEGNRAQIRVMKKHPEAVH